MEENRDFKGVWIPRQVIKLYGGKLASQAARFYYTTPDLNYNDIRSLKKNELLVKHTLSSADAKFMLQYKKHSLKGMGYGDQVCSWCGIKTVKTHSHHYPIPKAEGGKDTVDICPNCHQEYHYITEHGTLELSPTIKSLFNDLPLI